MHLVFVIDNVVEATFFREQLVFLLFSSSGVRRRSNNKYSIWINADQSIAVTWKWLEEMFTRSDRFMTIKIKGNQRKLTQVCCAILTAYPSRFTTEFKQQFRLSNYENLTRVRETCEHLSIYLHACVLADPGTCDYLRTSWDLWLLAYIPECPRYEWVLYIGDVYVCIGW